MLDSWMLNLSECQLALDPGAAHMSITCRVIINEKLDQLDELLVEAYSVMRLNLQEQRRKHANSFLTRDIALFIVKNRRLTIFRS